MGCEFTEKKNVLFRLMDIVKNHKSIIENKLASEKLDIYPAQHKLLMQLDYDNSISQKELAGRLQVSQATVAVSLKKLAKDGYVKKENQEADNRFNIITITDKGRKIIKKSVKIFDCVEEELFKGFSDEEVRMLGDFLKRMSNNLEEK